MTGRQHLGFRPWRPPGKLWQKFTRWLLPAGIPADELGPHTRAVNPLLTAEEIATIEQYTRHWIFRELAATRDYVRAVGDDPAQGDVHFQQYRKRVAEMFSHYRLQVMLVLATVSASRNHQIPPEEIEELFERAGHFRDWFLRRSQRAYRQHSYTPLLRAKWFFKEYLLAWRQAQ